MSGSARRYMIKRINSGGGIGLSELITKEISWSIFTIVICAATYGFLATKLCIGTDFLSIFMFEILSIDND